MSPRLRGALAAVLSLGLAFRPNPGSAGSTSWRASVYGPDDRRDLYEVHDERLLAWAAATAALFDESQVRPQAGWAELVTEPHGPREGLCRDERFFDQPAGAFGTGVLVGADLLLTAGHLITAETCPRTRFVFDFVLRDPDGRADRVRASEVYGCAEVVERRYSPPLADSALVKLDRPAAGRSPLELNRSGELAPGRPLVMIGHPAGLPAKVVAGRALRVFPGQMFFADLDSWARNSGSPVVNARTGKLEGILIRGGTDYRKDGACRRSFVCEGPECLSAVLAASQAAGEGSGR